MLKHIFLCYPDTKFTPIENWERIIPIIYTHFVNSTHTGDNKIIVSYLYILINHYLILI